MKKILCLLNLSHTWIGCKCARCGKEKHNWSYQEIACPECGGTGEVIPITESNYSINPDTTYMVGQKYKCGNCSGAGHFLQKDKCIDCGKSS